MKPQSDRARVFSQALPHKIISTSETSSPSLPPLTLPSTLNPHPLSRVPFSKTFSTPPRSMHRMAFLMCSWPWMEGARERASTSNTSYNRRELGTGTISFPLILTLLHPTHPSIPHLLTSPHPRLLIRIPSPSPSHSFCSPSSHSQTNSSAPQSLISSPHPFLPLTSSLLRPNLLIFFTS